MFGGDVAVDPITHNVIGVNDPHYSVINLYYKLLAIYQPEFDKLKDYYLNHTWHDYAVLLLQTAEFMNLTVRPPGFKPAPVPPVGHTPILSVTYELSVMESPVCAVPADPDPAKQAIRLKAGSQTEWLIVDITAPPVIISTGGGITQDQIISYLRSISKAELTILLTKVF